MENVETYPSSNPGVTPRRPRAPPESRENDDERDEVQDEGHDRVEILLKAKMVHFRNKKVKQCWPYNFQPAERQVCLNGVPHLEEVEEAPHEGDDEGGDNHEEEPVVVADAE